MKQPPPPYYQVAMAANQAPTNINENLGGFNYNAARHITEDAVANHNNPPAYDESSEHQPSERLPNTHVEEGTLTGNELNETQKP